MPQYGTTTEGDTYFNSRLYTADWDEATEDQRNRACMEASSRIDQLRFIGLKTDSTQALEWPRKNTSYGQTVTPQRVKDACFEIAQALLAGKDPEQDLENLSAISEGYSSARTTYTRAVVPQHFTAGIPSFTAWQYLKPLLVDVRRVRIRRVS